MWTMMIAFLARHWIYLVLAFLLGAIAGWFAESREAASGKDVSRRNA